MPGFLVENFDTKIAHRTDTSWIRDNPGETTSLNQIEPIRQGYIRWASLRRCIGARFVGARANVICADEGQHHRCEDGQQDVGSRHRKSPRRVEGSGKMVDADPQTNCDNDADDLHRNPCPQILDPYKGDEDGGEVGEGCHENSGKKQGGHANSFRRGALVAHQGWQRDELSYIITNIDINVNICYAVTDEKVPSYHAISRDVFGCIREFHDVEGTKRRNRAIEHSEFA